MASSRCITLVIFSILAVVDCVNLTDPDKGQVTYTAGTTFRQTVTYSCNTGYNLVGTVLAHVKLQHSGLGVYLPVKVCSK